MVVAPQHAYRLAVSPVHEGAATYKGFATIRLYELKIFACRSTSLTATVHQRDKPVWSIGEGIRHTTASNTNREIKAPRLYGVVWH